MCITPANFVVLLLLSDWVVCDAGSHGAQAALQVMPDDHSKLVPPLPIPNRTVKRLRADDSAATSVKVGYRQATILKAPVHDWSGVFFFADGNTSRHRC